MSDSLNYLNLHLKGCSILIWTGTILFHKFIYIGCKLYCLGKRRRTEIDSFPGANKILSEIKDRPKMKRVGFISKGAPARG